MQPLFYSIIVTINTIATLSRGFILQMIIYSDDFGPSFFFLPTSNDWRKTKKGFQATHSTFLLIHETQDIYSYTNTNSLILEGGKF